MSEATRPANASRRGILAAAAAAATVGLAQVVSPARKAAADDGQPVLIGAANTASTSTSWSMGPNGRVGLQVEADGAFNTGLRGKALQEGGSGVEGEADSPKGRGVAGTSREGTGVVGGSLDGIGVRATAFPGVALQVGGRIQATQAGIAVVPQGKKVVTIPRQVVAGSAVLATVNGMPQPGLYVAAARIQLPDKVVIALNVAATKPTKVAFFVLEQAPS